MRPDTFDPHSPPVITLEMIHGPQKHLISTCIITFSHVIYDAVLSSFPCRRIAEIPACNGNTPVYLFSFQGKELGIFLSHIGATAVGTFIGEANWITGADRFVMFGSAGCLNREATQGKLVVPTEAYRDEGISYHYAPAAPYIEIPNASKVAALLAESGAPYVAGRVWTTDAIYRETRAKVEARKAEGCLAVDMELAGAQAVCSFHGFQLYCFLMTGDVLDLPEWDVAELGEANHSLHNLKLALKIAAAVSDSQ